VANLILALPLLWLLRYDYPASILELIKGGRHAEPIQGTTRG
jgi:hypothetical protein